MRVIHVHTANTEQSGNLSRGLVTIHVPILRQTQWQVFVAPRSSRKNSMMMWAIHWLQEILVSQTSLIFVRIRQRHRWVHLVGVVAQMARSFVQFASCDVRRGNPHVPTLELLFL